MPSTAESILLALLDALTAAAPAGATVLRNAVLPEIIPAGGLLILRDGDPGEPEVTMSPLAYQFAHRAVVDVMVEDDDDAARDALFDSLRASVDAAVTADRTLGGRCLWVEAEAAPADTIAPEPGGPTLKGGSIPVALHYVAPTPLT